VGVPYSDLFAARAVTAAFPCIALLAPTLGGCRASAPEPLSVDAAPAQTTPHVRIVEAPAVGDVAPIVRDAVAEAKAGVKGAFVVYVGATWCEPCQRFHHAAEQGELDAAFPGMTLLEFDLDRDRDRLKAAGYTSKLIPLFALPADDGTASGKQVEGGIKGEGAVGFMVPRLQAILTRGS
jgi:thiol-disulfide isomerase/thioredoxin